jgi:hypothetical protein
MIPRQDFCGFCEVLAVWLSRKVGLQHVAREFASFTRHAPHF